LAAQGAVVTGPAGDLLRWLGAHSALHPAGPQARLVDQLWDAMLLTSLIVFLLVCAALCWAAVRRRADGESGSAPDRLRRMTTGVGWAVAATVVILIGFTLLDYRVGSAYTRPPAADALRIRLTGRQWWWQVEYRDSLPANWITTANEIHVPVGRPVVLELRAADVIHSVWVPALVGKRDLIPGKETSLWFVADTAGVYRGQCAEFCGKQHARMALEVVADPPDRFGAWLAGQRAAAPPPRESSPLKGRRVFLAGACVLCHTIQGTPAGGRVGPDLSHLASRRSIAAGTLPNTRGHLAGWILDPQRIKPGTAMPASALAVPELHALLDYLETLR
jgi:cytochrome c oxidase subunit 2